MHNDGKVVPINKAHATPSPLARLPVVLLQVRDKAAQQLQQGLQDLFDNADDTLFEMADRARDDVEQNIFFEAMRDLRLKRKNIERVFLEQFFEAFVGLTGNIQTALPQAFDTPAQQSGDDLERRVAVEAMVNKVLSRDGFALDQLTARLSTLLSKTLVTAHNPLGPAMLCEYFLRAGRRLQAQGVEDLEQFRRLQGLAHFSVEPVHDLRRQVGRADQALVGEGVDVGIAELGEGGQVGQRLGALGQRNREGADLARIQIRPAGREV